MICMEEKTLGELVKAWREASGLTQADLGGRAGVPYQSIQQLERGAVEHPRFLPRLAKVMGCTTDDLLARRLPPPLPRAGVAPADADVAWAYSPRHEADVAELIGRLGVQVARLDLARRQEIVDAFAMFVKYLGDEDKNTPWAALLTSLLAKDHAEAADPEQRAATAPADAHADVAVAHPGGSMTLAEAKAAARKRPGLAPVPPSPSPSPPAKTRARSSASSAPEPTEASRKARG